MSDKLAAAGSLIGLVSLLVIGIDALLIGGNGIWWSKIAIFSRIPKPFLGEGVNEEWAKCKRKELERGKIAHGPTNEPNAAIAWLRGDSTNLHGANGEEQAI